MSGGPFEKYNTRVLIRRMRAANVGKVLGILAVTGGLGAGGYYFMELREADVESKTAQVEKAVQARETSTPEKKSTATSDKKDQSARTVTSTKKKRRSKKRARRGKRRRMSRRR